MVFKYGSAEIDCDRCTETSGRYMLWNGSTPIRVLASIPPNLEITVEGGEIEHVPTPLEAAEDEINDLQADLAGAMARLAQVQDLLLSLGDGPTLTKLVQFVRDLKGIIAEAGNGEDQL